MTQFDPMKWAAILRGGAQLLESREARIAFRDKFGQAAVKTIVDQLQKRGVSGALLDEIRRDLGL